jgi:hypothetical protein
MNASRKAVEQQRNYAPDGYGPLSKSDALACDTHPLKAAAAAPVELTLPQPLHRNRLPQVFS